MAVIDKYSALSRAFNGIRHIKQMADDLKAQTGPIPFNSLSGRLDGMRESYLNGVQPLLDLGTPAQVNPIVTAFYAGSVPANTHAAMTAVGTALIDLYTAYDVVFDTLTPIEHTPAGGHTFASIPLAQLSTLSDELDAVLAAVAPLV